ncbi:ABC transporter permease [Crateriforma conspicua]|uniref:FtsX-like permease family protein n=1 Tax=Crateriforma conspicua TaxID=2527996 RepID=A0A5C5Y294_9PLAN|nr:ABC transporter permease [Crateriforma conspicua]TWT69290.1 FtsX-like permease family protein [Crateriforma conspicua]
MMHHWKLIRKLVVAPMRRRPGRAIITLIGVTASTCAVVWMVSGYDALVSKLDENADRYMGQFDFLMVPQGRPGSHPEMGDALITDLQSDPGVMVANVIDQSRVTVATTHSDSDEPSALGLLVGDRPPVFGAPPLDPTLVSTAAVEPPAEMVQGQWLTESSSSDVAVISRKAAERLGVNLGDTLKLTSIANAVMVKVVGVVEQPSDAPSLGGRGGGPGGGRSGGGRSGANGRGGADTNDLGPSPSNISVPGSFVTGVAVDAVYVRPPLAERINGYKPKASLVQLALRDTVSPSEFRRAWHKRLSSAKPPVQLVDLSDVQRGLESTRTVRGQRAQAWAATGMAAVAAVFIIFTTLSMGVSERSREFAMLRAIGLSRLQVAGVIAGESLILASVGWVAGLAAGAAMVMLGSRIFPGLFEAGAVLGTTTVVLSGVAVMTGALAAAVVPAWRAMRISPMDAMVDRVAHPRPAIWATIAMFGVALILLAPVLVFWVSLPPETRLSAYTLIAYPALMLGMLAITPYAVILCDRWVTPVIARIVGLNPRMMQQVVTNHLWRSIGAALALSVGLALYTSTQTWGYSMLQPFLPGDWMPDAFVAFHPVGLNQQQASELPQIPGVQADAVLPVAIEQAKFDWGDQPPQLLRQDNAIVCGVDPMRAFTGADPMLKMRFIEGDAVSAADAISRGGSCLISSDFQMMAGCGVGDTVRLIPPQGDGEVVEYQIAGVVTLPGWHWFTKFSGVRRHFVRTSTMVFANQADVQNDFRLGPIEYFWFNFDSAASEDAVESELQSLAERNAGAAFSDEQYGTITAYRPFARLTTTDRVLKSIRLRADEMIWGLSWMPLLTLAIMSLAIVNTMVASVRARTWEFGVMRSVGLSRWQLVRMIFCESVLIGLIACGLSLMFGLIAGWCGVGMALYGGSFFAGPPEFIIPWSQLAFGFAVTVGLCALAALWPAYEAGRAEPLDLLRAGRAAV